MIIFIRDIYNILNARKMNENHSVVEKIWPTVEMGKKRR